MEPKQILSSSLLDLLFEDRNKQYGAYELRKTYSNRVTKAMAITGSVLLLIFAGSALANSIKPSEEARINYNTVEIQKLTEEEIKPVIEQKKPEPQVRTEKLTDLKIVDDSKADDPVPTNDDLKDAKIDVEQKDGIDDKPIADPVDDLDKDKGIIVKQVVDDGPRWDVQVDAKFIGNWEKFLTRNLNASIPVDNGAPAGKYTVMMQFVVDVEGNVSNVQALTNHGYGMEQEAMRVLKRATQWEPAFQNGIHVKAYRRQPITFVIEGE